MAWEVKPSEAAELSTAMALAMAKREKEPKKRIAGKWSWRMLFTTRRLVFGSGVAIFFLLIMAVSTPNLLRSNFSARNSARMSRERAEVQAPPASPKQSSDYGYAGKITDGLVSQPPAMDAYRGRAATDVASSNSDEQIDSSQRTLDLPSVPMIARTAALTLTTKEFDKSRPALEEILKRHNGYMGELKVSLPAEAGRSLTATLRIPAQQLDSALAELKKLGRVEDESQGGDEVTQQYVDLQARLANGIHTEQRLTEILRTRTGKLQDVLKVELEIDRVRGEIEQMQAEKKELSKRVAFATLNTTVKEEYFAKLQGTPPSTGSRFRNAAVDGYNTVVEGLIDVGLFLLSAGPSLLLWAVILFFPARWAWRKVKAARKRGETVE
jgi:hypothetical protein